MTVKIGYKQLSEFITALFNKAGLNEDDAQMVSDVLTKAELRGITSHGVSRIPIYIERVEKGLVKATPDIKIIKETQATACIDGDFGLGQVVATKAMQLAIEKAKQCGIGIVTAKNSSHFGIAAYYSEMAAKEDMIGFSCSNVTALMAPPGGASKAIGNNPLSFSFPAGTQLPVIFDMACSAVAQGKIIVANINGKPIPEGWAVDCNGLPTTDAAEALKGFLLPAAGAKGYGLAVVIEMLAGVLSGSDVAKSLKSIYNLEATQNCGHFFMAIDINAFDDVEEFKKRADAFILEMKNGEKAKGSEEIFMPGEIELKKEMKISENGIEIPDKTFEPLEAVARKYNLSI